MRRLETRVSRLSLAVRLEDAFAAGQRVVGDVAVSLSGRPWRSLRNPSGDVLFLDLPPGPATVLVSPTLYLAERRDVVLPLPTQVPVLAVTLTPAWLYPFPPGATLVQGLAQASDGAPVAGAVATLVGRSASGRSGADGRFVIPVTGLAEDDVTVVDGRRLVKAASVTRFTVRLEHPAFQRVTADVGEIEEGKRTVIAHALSMTRS